MNQPGVHQVLHEYVEVLQRMIHDLDFDAVMRVRAHLLAAREMGRTIYLAGNGGSAATASHWANDLGKATRRPDAKPIRVICLNDHGAWLTALANDEGYQHAFSGQLQNFVEPGDVLVVFSASGNSANLIEAVAIARSGGAVTIAMLGFDGGTLKGLVHDSIWLPTPKGAYGQVEDAHLVVCHLLTTSLAPAPIPAATPRFERIPDSVVT